MKLPNQLFAEVQEKYYLATMSAKPKHVENLEAERIRIYNELSKRVLCDAELGRELLRFNHEDWLLIRDSWVVREMKQAGFAFEVDKNWGGKKVVWLWFAGPTAHLYRWLSLTYILHRLRVLCS